MWTVKVTPSKGLKQTDIKCQYLTDMLDAVKAAASDMETIHIIAERVEDHEYDKG
jgi:hypothetical protein|tara:strand:- start:1584 stop:1748 length:165 start_codon:yes stop_codon:yes gene_type:complete